MFITNSCLSPYKKKTQFLSSNQELSGDSLSLIFFWQSLIFWRYFGNHPTVNSTVISFSFKKVRSLARTIPVTKPTTVWKLITALALRMLWISSKTFSSISTASFILFPLFLCLRALVCTSRFFWTGLKKLRTIDSVIADFFSACHWPWSWYQSSIDGNDHCISNTFPYQRKIV